MTTMKNWKRVVDEVQGEDESVAEKEDGDDYGGKKDA